MVATWFTYEEPLRVVALIEPWIVPPTMIWLALRWFWLVKKTPNETVRKAEVKRIKQALSTAQPLIKTATTEADQRTKKATEAAEQARKEANEFRLKAEEAQRQGKPQGELNQAQQAAQNAESAAWQAELGALTAEDDALESVDSALENVRDKELVDKALLILRGRVAGARGPEKEALREQFEKAVNEKSGESLDAKSAAAVRATRHGFGWGLLAAPIVWLITGVHSSSSVKGPTPSEGVTNPDLGQIASACLGILVGLFAWWAGRQHWRGDKLWAWRLVVLLSTVTAVSSLVVYWMVPAFRVHASLIWAYICLVLTLTITHLVGD